MNLGKYGIVNFAALACLIVTCIGINCGAETLWEAYVAEVNSDLNRTHFYDDYAFYQDWIKGRFDVGFRFTDYKFDRQNASSENDKYFIGSIDRIEEVDRDLGLRNLKIAWFPFYESKKWFSRSQQSNWAPFINLLEKTGVELTWDELRAKTITSADEVEPAYTDGTIVVKGPMLSCIVNVENSTPVTPYFGLGLAIYNDISVTKGWWHWGFGNEESYRQWVEEGSTGNPNGGWRRTFNIDDDWGTFWYIGAAIKIYDNWDIDIFYRDTNIEFDNKFTISVGDKVVNTRRSKWDLSNKTYGMGIKYTF